MIPDEAMDAALKAIGHLPTVTNESRRKTVQAILEAAAPHLMAAAWDQGAEAEASAACDYYIPCGSCATCTGPDLINPYRKPTDA